MLVPLSWLREYVDVDLTPERLAERLTVLGMEVKGVERRGADWQQVVVGELLEVAPHPGSDHLSLTRVRVGDDQPVLSIVCGATNIAAGQRVPVALPGAVLPGGRLIEVAQKAGVASQGMLCSGDELRLTGDADGILILPGDTPLGRPLVDLFGDDVLDVDVKPNRGDALSLVGLAREVAAATGASLRWPRIVLDEQGDPTASRLAVEVLDEALCPRFVGRVMDGVTVGPSPLEVQVRLGAAGTRPISNVVDASNYVMLELGKPIHTYDAAAVHEGHVIVRLARPGERFETIDHVVRDLTPDTLLIADPHGPLGIAGVMGGAASEVWDGTSAVIIESAIFDPVSIRRTAQRYALRSEASLRFEKGQEHRLARLGAERTAQLIAAWAGGRIAPGAVDTSPREPVPGRLPFRPARISRLLGISLQPAEMRGLLARVEVGTEAAQPGDVVPIGEGTEPITLGADAGDALVAIVPTHRRDLQIEADVAEEVARVRGFETIPGRRPETPMPDYRPDPHRVDDAVRDLLAGRGLNEVVTHALLSPEDHVRLGIDPDERATIRAANPVSADHSQLRRSMLPGLLAVLVENERQRRPDVGCFEVGSVHRLVNGQPEESPQIAILVAGDQAGAAWNQPARPADFWEASGIVAWLCDRLAVGRVGTRPASAQAGVEHPGRTAEVFLTRPDGSTAPLGRVAELDPRYVEAAGARAGRVAVALLDLAMLREAVPAVLRHVALPRVPVVERDLAVVARADLAAGELERVIRASAGTLLRGLRLFDVYAGPPLAEDERSLAYRLVLQAPDRTLTDEEVEAALDGVIQALATECGARIRR